MVAKQEKIMRIIVHRAALSAQWWHRWKNPWPGTNLPPGELGFSGGRAQKGTEELLLGSTGDTAAEKSPEHLGFGTGLRRDLELEMIQTFSEHKEESLSILL